MAVAPLPSGYVFGRLTVIECVGTNSTRKRLYRCSCECGATIVVPGNSLQSGNTKSCGCYRRERQSEANKTHGHYRSSTYESWRSMWSRCRNPNETGYAYYGGSGITVCERWRSFPAFLSDMGERPEGTSIDRVDGTRSYEPDNCRWASTTTQCRNRTSVKLTPDAVRHIRSALTAGTTTSAELAKHYGVGQSTIYSVKYRLTWREVI